METRRLETLKQIAAGVAAQFGSNCEVVIHDVSGNRAGSHHRTHRKRPCIRP